MLSEIVLRSGSSVGQPALRFKPTPITVFVGPNNSGKSKVLQELFQFFQNGKDNTNSLILNTCNFSSMTQEEADALIQTFTVNTTPADVLQEGHTLIGHKGERRQVPFENLRNGLANPDLYKNLVCSWFYRMFTLMLDGSGRIGLTKPQGIGDFQQPGTTPIQILARDDALRENIRRKMFDAMGSYLVIDPTSPGSVRYKFSSTIPASASTERSFEQHAVEFHKNAIDMELMSDGVKAFTGILTEVVAGEPKLIFIDEPEAFLHPSLAFKIGLEISSAVLGSSKRLFVSTHSSDFLMGCIQSGTPINIVRLTYRNGVATARLLSSDSVLRMMRNPLLRSTGVLAGLFYEFVAVAESDADRAFYQEINERLVRFGANEGVPNCLFLNAQNKQTIYQIVRPLRELGIPAAGIVDIDIVKEGGQVWSRFLEAGFVPSISVQSLSSLRANVKNALEATGKDMKRDGGLALLNSSEREAANNLFDQLAHYGLFTVRSGELESWLKSLRPSSTHSPDWLIEIFEKMGEDPEDPKYVKPGKGDVWDFSREIAKWFLHSSRKGMPN